MFEAFVNAVIKSSDAIAKIPPLVGDLVQQLNEIRLTLTKIEEQLMNITDALETGVEPVNELAPESAKPNGNDNH
ncbi:MAG: hypothetical protein VKK42_26015 [Lyngbya sp.]|nr:hypothetical protein [Lyngbya sp.]